MLQLNWNLVCELINLLVLCFLLKRFLIGPVTAVMEKRRAMIEDGLLNARNSEKQASKLKNQYEESLKNARSESARILEDARKRAREEYDRILKEADQAARETARRAEENIEIEKGKAMAGIQSRIAEVALLAARKAAGETGSAQDNLALYDRFLKEAGEACDADSR